MRLESEGESHDILTNPPEDDRSGGGVGFESEREKGKLHFGEFL